MSKFDRKKYKIVKSCCMTMERVPLDFDVGRDYCFSKMCKYNIGPDSCTLKVLFIDPSVCFVCLFVCCYKEEPICKTI